MSMALDSRFQHRPAPTAHHRLLWWALGGSLLIHLALLLPTYGFWRSPQLLPEGDRSIRVTLRKEGSLLGADAPKTASTRATEPARRAAKSSAAPKLPPVIQRQTARSAPRPMQHGLPSINDLIAQAAPAANASNPASQPATGDGGNRRVTLTSGMKDYRYAQYFEAWRQKVERLGAMNYPEEARDKSGGQLVLAITLRADGSIKSMRLVQSSGNKVYDEAAQRIARMGEPYAAFPPDIRKETDYMDIVRVWSFTRSNRLETR